MKIGLVLPALPAYSETFFKNKIQGLEQSGDSVILFVNARSNQNEFFGARVIYTLPFKKRSIPFYWDVLIKIFYLFFFRFRILLKYWKLLQQESYPILFRFKLLVLNRNVLRYHLDWLHFGFGTMALERELVSKAIGAKMAVSFRGYDIYIYPIKHPNCYTKTWRFVDKIHIISDGIQRKVHELGGAESLKKCFKITPAIDIDLFQSETSVLQFQAPFQFTTVARLHWIKGLVYTLKALSLLKKKGVSFHYTLIGTGKEMEQLHFIIRLLSLEQNVTFAGKCSQEEIRNKLRETHLYIQYSIQEGFCNSVLEAQAMGVYCLVSDAEGLTENIEDGKTGSIVKKRKPALLASEIQRVLSVMTSDNQSFTNYSRTRIQANFSIQKQQMLFQDFYNA